MKDVREIINSLDDVEVTEFDKHYFIVDSYEFDEGLIVYNIIIDKSGKYAAWKLHSKSMAKFVKIDFTEYKEDYNTTELKYYEALKDMPQFEKSYDWPIALARDVYPEEFEGRQLI